MDKSNSIEIVRGDMLEAEFYLVGSTPNSKYFVADVYLANGYSYHESTYGEIQKYGTTIFYGTEDLQISPVSNSKINICAKIDDQNNTLSIPSVLTQCFSPGYYSYDIVCQYTNSNIFTPVYCNTLTIRDRLNKFGPSTSEMTRGVKFSNDFYLSNGIMEEVIFKFTRDSYIFYKVFNSDNLARGVEISCDRVEILGFNEMEGVGYLGMDGLGRVIDHHGYTLFDNEILTITRVEPDK